MEYAFGWPMGVGHSATTTLAALTQPEMTVEVAAFMQDEVVGDVRGAWPGCASHGVGLHPALASDGASWVCRQATTSWLTLAGSESR